MSDQTAADTPSASVITPVTMRINGPGTTAKHLFGIEAPMFDMSKRSE